MCGVGVMTGDVLEKLGVWRGEGIRGAWGCRANEYIFILKI